MPTSNQSQRKHPRQRIKKQSFNLILVDHMHRLNELVKVNEPVLIGVCLAEDALDVPSVPKYVLQFVKAD
jgi:hypothetical protein